MSRPVLLLCTDLDRTLLPNGDAPLSPQAMPLLSRLVERDDIWLAYVTGRDQALIESAIHQYDLPLPDYVIADVGTSIYSTDANEWRLWNNWHTEISSSWRGLAHTDLHRTLQDIDVLTLQEKEKQSRYKLSYYASGEVDAESLQKQVKNRLAALEIECSVVWSIDETRSQGLLDILPASANKFHAVDFLLSHRGCDFDNTLYAGDSGNDIDVLSSPLRSVLVANATAEVRHQAEQLATQRGYRHALYLAEGGCLGMNGNYAAGIIEGVVHFYPQLLPYLNDNANN